MVWGLGGISAYYYGTPPPEATGREGNSTPDTPSYWNWGNSIWGSGPGAPNTAAAPAALEPAPPASVSPSPTMSPEGPQTWIGYIPDKVRQFEATEARDRALTLTEQVSEYVRGYFEFLQEEYSHSVSLDDFIDAVLRVMNEVVRLARVVFPFIPNPQDPLPAPVVPPTGNVPYVDPIRFSDSSPSPSRKEQEQEISKLTQETVFKGAKCTPEEVRFCGLIGRLVVLLMQPLHATLKDPRFDLARQDPEAARRKREQTRVIAGALLQNVDGRHLRELKRKEIGRLGNYLGCALQVLKEITRDTDKKRLFVELSQKNLVAAPFQTLPHDPKEAMAKHFYALLRPRLDRYLGEKTLQVATPETASLIANLLAETVVDQTSKDRINGHFHFLMEVIKKIDMTPWSGPTKPPSPPASPNLELLSKSEIQTTVGLVDTFLTKLCRESLSGYAQSFESQIVEQINTGLTPYLSTGPENEVALQFGMINTLFEGGLDHLENPTPDTETQARIQRQEKAVNKFFDKKEGLTTTQKLVLESGLKLISGLAELRQYLIAYPELSQNLVCLIIEDAVKTLLPLPEDSQPVVN